MGNVIILLTNTNEKVESSLAKAFKRPKCDSTERVYRQVLKLPTYQQERSTQRIHNSLVTKVN